MLEAPPLSIMRPDPLDPKKPVKGGTAAAVIGSLVAVGAIGALGLMEVSRTANTIYPGQDTRFDAVASEITSSKHPTSWEGQAVILTKRADDFSGKPQSVLGVIDTNSRGCIEFDVYTVGTRNTQRKFYCPTKPTAAQP